jgi:tRNA pseudouridine55 synthase
MGRRRQQGRSVNGILLLNKPVGLTSNDALQQVKRLYYARKAGHTGSLDPLADGLLPICFGAATKLSAYLLDADKRYRVRVRLGVTTTTGDREGEVLESRPVQGVTEAEAERVLERFTGAISQLPPMYSALKHKGQRLYALARKGIEVEREPRTVRIHTLRLQAWAPPELELDVHCSKGTYVRTLAEDIGNALGCGGHVVALTRTGVGPYGADRMVDLRTLVELAAEEQYPQMAELLLPLDSALEHWPEVLLSGDAAYYLQQGQPVLVPRAPTEGWVRLYTADRRFLGVGQIQGDGRVAPKRLMQEG